MRRITPSANAPYAGYIDNRDGMKRIAWIIWGWMALLISVSANANDSIARVGAGGITFLKSEDIRMAQEVLEISTKSIRVKYRFQNDSDKDIQATVAFPMPPYRWNAGESASDINIKPFRPFATQVNGHSVATKIAKRAMIKGEDVTSLLYKIGLTDQQIFETFAHCPDDGSEKKFELCGISKNQETLIKKLGDWDVSETALWEQVFPANKKINVLHEYTPLVGESYGIPYQKGFGNVSDILVKPENSEACVDDGVQSAIQRRVKSLADYGAKEVWVWLKEVEYILGTGRNWKGPIADFKLRIKKDSPDQFISLCFPGKPRRIGETVFEFSQKNFIPQDKLIIYFYNVSDGSPVR